MPVSGNGRKRPKRGADGRFEKGGGPGPGRPPGLTDANAPTDAAVLDFIARAKVFFSTERYWTGVETRIMAGQAAHVESYLLPRIFGKPKEVLAFEGGGLGFNIVLMGPVRDPLAEPGEEGGGPRRVPPQKALPPARKPRGTG